MNNVCGGLIYLMFSLILKLIGPFVATYVVEVIVVELIDDDYWLMRMKPCYIILLFSIVSVIISLLKKITE